MRLRSEISHFPTHIINRYLEYFPWNVIALRYKTMRAIKFHGMIHQHWFRSLLGKLYSELYSRWCIHFYSYLYILPKDSSDTVPSILQIGVPGFITHWFKVTRPSQNGSRFADDICIFVNKILYSVLTFTEIYFQRPVNNRPAPV